MFCVLLIPPECVSVCLALRLAVWCRADDPLSSHRLPSPPKRSGYGRNAASPPTGVRSYFLAAPPGAAVALEAWLRFFQISSSLPSCPDLVRAVCSC